MWTLQGRVYHKLYAVTSVIHGFMVSPCILQTWIISLTNGIVLSVYEYSSVVDYKRNLDMHKIRFKEDCMKTLIDDAYLSYTLLSL
jgi:hypothetical protein